MAGPSGAGRAAESGSNAGARSGAGPAVAAAVSLYRDVPGP